MTRTNPFSNLLSNWSRSKCTRPWPSSYQRNNTHLSQQKEKPQNSSTLLCDKEHPFWALKSSNWNKTQDWKRRWDTKTTQELPCCRNKKHRQRRRRKTKSAKEDCRENKGVVGRRRRNERRKLEREREHTYLDLGLFPRWRVAAAAANESSLLLL